MDGACTAPQNERPLVLHAIVDLPELRSRRGEKQPRKSLLAKVSKSKFGQKLHGMLNKEPRAKSGGSSDENDSSLDAVGKSSDADDVSPIMNNKRAAIHRNPTYVERDEERNSCNDSYSSDDFDHYPGTLDLGNDFNDFENRHPDGRAGRNSGRNSGQT